MSEKCDGVFDFEKLVVYQRALEFFDEVIKVCRQLPQNIRYAVGDQMIRAALSISNNLAEGAGKSFKKEKARYYGTSIDSARECLSMLNVLRRQDCVTEERYIELRGRCREITAMLYGLIRALNLSTRTLVHS